MTTISVAIVSYNTREHVRACLETVRDEHAHEVIVVDNASSDGTAEMIRAEYPWVVLDVSPTNRGYGAASNRAIARSSGDYVFLLNSDVRLRPGALAALSAYLDEHPEAGLLGPRLHNPDGTLQISCFPFPTPLYVLLKESSLGPRMQHVPLLRDLYLPTWSHSHSRDVPWVLGAALAIRRTAFDAVGGFDERFFMYSEEVNLCLRLRAAGWQIHFAPVTEVVHIGGASTARHRAAMSAQLYASQVQFYRQHYSTWRRVLLHVVIGYIMARNIARDALLLLRTGDVARRVVLGEDLAVWSTVLIGAG